MNEQVEGCSFDMADVAGRASEEHTETEWKTVELKRVRY